MPEAATTIYINGSGSSTIYGGEGNDTFYHSENSFDDGVSRMNGGAGDDLITSFVSGADVLDGGAGNDWLSLSEGNTAYGGTGDDTYDLYNIFDPYDSQSDVTIVEYANGGYDTIEANFSSFNFFANIEAYVALYSKDVTVHGNDSANDASLSGGNDYAKMNGGNDKVHASGGNDIAYGDAGNDTLDGGDGSDYLYGGTGNDLLVGGSSIPGTPDGDDFIYGEDGDDKLYGGFGTDYLSGGAGNDYLSGGWAAYGPDQLVGGIGNDTYHTDGTGTITELANQGIDTIEFYGYVMTMAANVENLVHVHNPDGSLYDADATTVTGNLLANSIAGNDRSNTFYGEAGADTLSGQGGNDVMHGGNDNDRIFGDNGSDLMYGESGNDIVYGGTGNDFAYGGVGDDVLFGEADNDSLIGETGNDTLYGGSGNDYVNGGAGYDKLCGEDGDDNIHAGTLNDYVYGNDGNDRLYGDAGSDFMWGGTGSDAFAYTYLADSRIGDGIDRIQDFEQGVDKIDLFLIDANANLAGNQAFTWAGMHMPEVVQAGTLWGQAFAATNYAAEFVRVYADVNGDGMADMSIDVMSHTSLVASDFLL